MELEGDRLSCHSKTTVTKEEAPPASHIEPGQFAPETATESEVWVNTRSSKYFKPGSRYYGKTKQGKYVTEIDALDSRYLPAGGTGR